MAERIQLKEPGSELVMLVGAVTPQLIERNEYFLFTNGKVELLVPQSSIKGRYERLGISGEQQMVGKSVRFARSVKKCFPLYQKRKVQESGKATSKPAFKQEK